MSRRAAISGKDMSGNPTLPPGQRETATFPRFGLPRYAFRFPKTTAPLRIAIRGDAVQSAILDWEPERIGRTEQSCDFHCVTTWTHRDLRWSGVRFADFYERIVKPLVRPDADATLLVLHGQDGYQSALPLIDMLAQDVLLADMLDNAPLSVAHGAPLRLIAPAHYGYKAVKHIEAMEFRRSDAGYRPVGLRFMAHPRARVAFEERGRWIPGWILRRLYRPLIGPTSLLFRRALNLRASPKA